MSDGLASVEPNGPLYRVGRQPDPWAWPDGKSAALPSSNHYVAAVNPAKQELLRAHGVTFWFMWKRLSGS
jgi:hypothetical protein